MSLLDITKDPIMESFNSVKRKAVSKNTLDTVSKRRKIDQEKEEEKQKKEEEKQKKEERDEIPMMLVEARVNVLCRDNRINLSEERRKIFTKMMYLISNPSKYYNPKYYKYIMSSFSTINNVKSETKYQILKLEYIKDFLPQIIRDGKILIEEIAKCRKIGYKHLYWLLESI